MRPRLVLLDEPAAGMNPAETDDLRERLGRIASERGLAVLLIDHDLPFVMSLSADIIVLDRGRIIATGSPAAVQANPAVIEAYIGGEVAHAT
jgi:ABC-type branched-subunit amino acid transport system ATPase component